MIKPFQNESETYEIDGLTVENRLDQVSIYGSIDITPDKKGMKSAQKIKALMDAIIDTLRVRP